LPEKSRAFSLFAGLKKYQWVLPLQSYKDLPGLLSSLEKDIIEPAEKKVRRLEDS